MRKDGETMNAERGEWLTYKDVAAWLKVSTKTVRRYVDEGKLRCVRLSKRCVRFSVIDVQEFIEAAGGAA